MPPLDRPARSPRLLPRRRERAHGPRRPDAVGLDAQPLGRPRLAAIRGAVAGPGEAIGPDVVVADAPERRVGRAHAELLLDVHLVAHAVRGAHILQPAAPLR